MGNNPDMRQLTLALRGSIRLGRHRARIWFDQMQLLLLIIWLLSTRSSRGVVVRPRSGRGGPAGDGFLSEFFRSRIAASAPRRHPPPPGEGRRVLSALGWLGLVCLVVLLTLCRGLEGWRVAGGAAGGGRGDLIGEWSGADLRAVGKRCIVS